MVGICRVVLMRCRVMNTQLEPLKSVFDWRDGDVQITTFFDMNSAST